MKGHIADVENQIEKIADVFQNALYISSGQAMDIPAYLVNVDAEFRSVAYEGIAMRAAMKDFSNRTLYAWSAFLDVSHLVYQSHICIGLGWAIAKQRLTSLDILSDLTSLMLFRVADGHGFYDGMFKLSGTQQAAERPSIIHHSYDKAYDQGIGRSLWYSCKGDIRKIQQYVNAFAVGRHADLWRGIGLACAFVGGHTVPMLQMLYNSAAQYRIQLAIGSALVTRARIQTNTLNNSLEQICQCWCNLQAHQIMSITEAAGEKNVSDYRVWLAHIEKALAEVSVSADMMS